jgi:hypothetical protein
MSSGCPLSVAKQTSLRSMSPAPHNIYEVYYLSQSHTELRKSAACHKLGSGGYKNEAKYDESYEMRQIDSAQPIGIFCIFPTD